ncbi:MAG: glycosyltransferase [Olsenella sp.]|nr:glycosyltransferase [Olsenella sp.]
MIEGDLVSNESRIPYVDDGTCDATWQVTVALASRDLHFADIQQSRNREHQAAVVAGLMEARAFADVAISADCDGQDDIHAMTAMVERYREGYGVVYGVRSSRTTDTAFKCGTAKHYYRLLQGMGEHHVHHLLRRWRPAGEPGDYRRVRGQKTYLEAKRRPVYIISCVVGDVPDSIEGVWGLGTECPTPRRCPPRFRSARSTPGQRTRSS